MRRSADTAIPGYTLLSIAAWVLALSMGLLPLVHWPFARDPNLAKPLFIAVAVAVLGLLAAALILRGERPRMRWLVADICVVAYAAFTVLSLAYSRYPNATADTARLVVLSALLYFAARFFLTGPASRMRLALALVLGCAAVSAVGAAERFGALPWGVRGEICATWFNRTFLAAHLLLALPVAVWCALRAGWASRIAGGAALLLGVVALVLTHARISYVAVLPMAAAAAAAAWPIASARWRRGIMAACLGMVAASTGPHVASARLHWLPSPPRVIADAFSPDVSGANQIRSAQMVAAARLGCEKPILGWGAGTYGIHSTARFPRDAYRAVVRDGPVRQAIVNTNAHNEFLEVFAELGVVGVLVFTGMLVSAWWSLRRTVRRKDVPLDEKHLAVALATGMSGFLCANLVGMSMRVPGEAALFYVSLALLLSLGAPAAWARAQPSMRALRAAVVGPALILCSIIGWTYLTECRASVHIGAGEGLLGSYGSVGSAAAVDAFRAACRLSPDNVQARYGLGNALAVAGRLEEALPEFEAVERLWPHYGRVHFNKGTCYAQLGRLKDAEREIRLAYWQDRLPDSREALDWLRGQLRTSSESAGAAGGPDEEKRTATALPSSRANR